MIEVRYLPTLNLSPTPEQKEEMRRVVERSMADKGGIYSAHGLSAELAISWCRKQGLGYQLTVHPSGGCHLQAISPSELDRIDSETILNKVKPKYAVLLSGKPS